MEPIERIRLENSTRPRSIVSKKFLASDGRVVKDPDNQDWEFMVRTSINISGEMEQAIFTREYIGDFDFNKTWHDGTPIEDHLLFAEVNPETDARISSEILEAMKRERQSLIHDMCIAPLEFDTDDDDEIESEIESFFNGADNSDSDDDDEDDDLLEHYEEAIEEFGESIEWARFAFSHLDEFSKDKPVMIDDKPMTILANEQYLANVAVHAVVVDRFGATKFRGWVKDDHTCFEFKSGNEIENGDYLIICCGNSEMTYTNTYRVIKSFKDRLHGWFVLTQLTDIEFDLIINQKVQYEADMVYYALAEKEGCDDDDDYFD